MLDFVREDAGSLQPHLSGSDDQQARRVFRRRSATSSSASSGPPSCPEPPRRTCRNRPASRRNYQEHIRILCDLLVLAFQADVTRVCTFVLRQRGQQPAVSVHQRVRKGTTTCRTTATTPQKQAKIAATSTASTSQQLAYLLGKLEVIREGDGTLLDHCMIAYGSGNSDGNRHNHDDLPILLAGKGCGTISTGRHIRYPARHAAQQPVAVDARPHGLRPSSRSATAPAAWRGSAPEIRVNPTAKAALGQTASGFFHGEQDMAIIVECPVCAKTLQAPNDAAGKGCRCPLCHSLVTIPLDEPAPPAAERPLSLSAVPLGRVAACPTCGKSLTIPPELERASVACPFCDGEFRSGGGAYPERKRRVRRRRFRCPYCDSSELPIETRRVSSAGWAVFVIFLLFFLPLFWIGLLITEPETRCYDCRRRLY